MRARLFLGIASRIPRRVFGGGHIFQRGDLEIRLAAGHDGNRPRQADSRPLPSVGRYPSVGWNPGRMRPVRMHGES